MRTLLALSEKKKTIEFLITSESKTILESRGLRAHRAHGLRAAHRRKLRSTGHRPGQRNGYSTQTETEQQPVPGGILEIHCAAFCTIALADTWRRAHKGTADRIGTFSTLIPIGGKGECILPTPRTSLSALPTCSPSGALPARPAHILGGWSPSTLRFPKNHGEIVKIHDFS